MHCTRIVLINFFACIKLFNDFAHPELNRHLIRNKLRVPSYEFWEFRSKTDSEYFSFELWTSSYVLLN